MASKPTVYVVQALRALSDGGYIVGVFKKKAKATMAAAYEEDRRGGKYKVTVSEWVPE